ncbi:hypothetical protein FE810_15220 [Thalassotalea litorea]|uniref:Uncharacterized protein n=1 Tax=Thalassotalea litorea TaxID=2020715 RepID=A0A5R9IFG5_9GAMM|nr:hypothetical protein [Thalassotalea litorea]TLU61360.1 hypothetical protein FE810_15220 [Thalassotalea litorea]
MRKFVGVDKKEQLALRKQFPQLLPLIKGETTPEYTLLAISIFDHWLNDEECMEFLHMPQLGEIERRCLVFDQFNKLLMERSSILAFRFKGRIKSLPSFKKFSSSGVKYSYMKQTSMGKYKVILPDFDAVYFEGYDDTNIFFLKDLSVKPIIEKLAEKVGLYCLEHR